MWIYAGLAVAALLTMTVAGYFIPDPEDEFVDVHPDDEW